MANIFLEGEHILTVDLIGTLMEIRTLKMPFKYIS